MRRTQAGGAGAAATCWPATGVGAAFVAGTRFVGLAVGVGRARAGGGAARRDGRRGGRRGGFGPVPVAHAPAAVPEVGLDLRIVAPLLAAGVGIQGYDDVAGRADVDGAARHLRRVLVLIAGVGRNGGAEGPGDLQLVDVLAIDLVHRGISRSPGVAPIGAPVARPLVSRRPASRRLAPRWLGPHHGRRGRLAPGEGGRKGPRLDAEQDQRRQRHRRPRLVAPRPPGRRRDHQQQEQAQDRRGEQARQQRPEGEAGLPQRPAEGGRQGRGVDQARSGMAADRHDPRGRHRGAGQQVVGRTAPEDEIATAQQQGQADERHEPAPDPRPDAGRPARRPVAHHRRPPRALRQAPPPTL